MNAQDDGQTEHRTAPADTKDRAIAVLGAWAFASASRRSPRH